jgi:hypothetical protein
MLLSGRKLSALTLAMATFALAACSDDDPTENTVPPVLGASAAPNPAATTTSIVVTFQSRAGDNSYNIERAEGATGGTFAQVGTVQAPATVGPVAYTDNALKLNTTYQYRVFAVRGSKTSAARFSA